MSRIASYSNKYFAVTPSLNNQSPVKISQFGRQKHESPVKFEAKKMQEPIMEMKEEYDEVSKKGVRPTNNRKRSSLLFDDQAIAMNKRRASAQSFVSRLSRRKSASDLEHHNPENHHDSIDKAERVVSGDQGNERTCRESSKVHHQTEVKPSRRFLNTDQPAP